MTAPEKLRDGRSARWEHRRPELLHAATEYVLEHGVASMTLRPLAADLGVTITTIVRQFGSKEALIQEITQGIRARWIEELERDTALHALTPVETLRAMWQRWLEPSRARGFALLFELYGLAIRDPDRYRWFTESVVRYALAPVEAALIREGRTPDEARTMATIVVALVRGLHLDLAATRDTARVDAAFELAVAVFTRRE
jgi:AcrR family transcriptional regulator